MPSTSPIKTNRQLYQVPVSCVARVCFDAREQAHHVEAAGLGLLSNFGCIWRNDKSHTAHSVTPSSTNLNKSDTFRWIPYYNKVGVAFFSRSAAAPMYNELRDGPAAAYRT